jgi:hypothetical protein
MFRGKIIILQPRHLYFILDKNKISKMAAWIHFQGLPFPLLNETSLGMAANMVGTPWA